MCVLSCVDDEIIIILNFLFLLSGYDLENNLSLKWQQSPRQCTHGVFAFSSAEKNSPPGGAAHHSRFLPGTKKRRFFFFFFFLVPGTMFHNRGSIIAQYTYVIYIENDLVRLCIPSGALSLDPQSLALRFVGFTHSACHYYSQLVSTTQIGLATTLIIDVMKLKNWNQ